MSKLTIKLTINEKYAYQTNKVQVNLNLDLYIHEAKLDVVNSFEYLGIHVDNCLVMNNHVDSVYKKCMTKLGMLYKIRAPFHKSLRSLEPEKNVP